MSVTARESVDHEVTDDGAILFGVERSASGKLTAQFRVYGHIVIDGKKYTVDREVRVAVKRDRD